MNFLPATELTNRILILSSPERILDAAYRVEQWPHLLGHYRWVKILSEGPAGRTVQMAARRGRFPLKWTALQWRDDDAKEVHFRHLRGPTRGMDVVWKLEPLAGPMGETRVTIRHDLRYPVPLLGPLIARYIVGGLFIHPVATRTLHCFKQILEDQG
jgi:ribosome-associated toxin RatA of RatAB toxin-antitoxin module